MCRVENILESRSELDVVFCDYSTNAEYGHSAGLDLIARLERVETCGPFIARKEKFLEFITKHKLSTNSEISPVVISKFIAELSDDEVAHLALQVAHIDQIDYPVEKPLKPTNLPFVSIIIPNRNSIDLITETLASLYQKTDYSSFEVIIIDNGTNDQKVLNLYNSYKDREENFSFYINHEPFNFSRMINRGIRQATGDFFLLLNNDIEVIRPHWLKEMTACFRYEDTGIVGAKLLYPNDTIQHAGVIVGLNNFASHWFYKEQRDTRGPNNCLGYRRSMVCVTGAVMAISRACYEAIGAWDEGNFAVAYNDVDYCIRAYNKGFRCIWTPYAELYHHESASRGKARSFRSRWRLHQEKKNLKRIHGTHKFKDPVFSPRFKKKPGKLTLKKELKAPRPRRWWC